MPLKVVFKSNENKLNEKIEKQAKKVTLRKLITVQWEEEGLQHR